MNKDNLQEIFEYVNKNGAQGYLSFKTSSDGMKYFQRVEKEFKGPARPEFKGHTSKNSKNEDGTSAKRSRAKRSLGHELEVDDIMKKMEVAKKDSVGAKPNAEGKRVRKKRPPNKLEKTVISSGLNATANAMVSNPVKPLVQHKEYVPMNIPYERAPKFKLEIRREGSFEAGDKIERVESVVGELDDDLEFLVIWQEKSPGLRPKETKLPGKIIRMHDPRALLDYYTKNIIITKPLD